MTPTLTNILFSLLGGILPALLWLSFWLREDKSHPEPRSLIALTFFYGIISVPITFFIQMLVNYLLIPRISVEAAIQTMRISGYVTLVIWAMTEEFLKYIAAKKGGLSKKANDEPIDALIYMITAALGFSAAENTLFLIAPLLDGNLADAFITTNMRFIGATLLHVASSAIIGISIALSYFFKKKIQKHYLYIGFILSVLLHTLFNFFIIKDNTNVFIAFVMVWIVIVGIILLFEKIKKIHLNKI